MIPKIKDHKDLSRTLPLLQEKGVFMVENYIDGNALNELHDEVLQLTSQGGSYELGNHHRGGNLNSHKSMAPAVFNTYDQQWMKTLNQSYRNQVFCKNIFATHDLKPQTDGSAPNAWLHYDKQRCLKFFIYLTDVDKRSGAFYCSPGSIKETSRLRNTIKEYSQERRLEKTFPELVKKYPPEAIEGKAGTLIVFDTDCFHKGGVCEPGAERLVVRGHCA